MGRLRVLGNAVPYNLHATRFTLPHRCAFRYLYTPSSLRTHLPQYAHRFTLHARGIASRPASAPRYSAPQVLILPPTNCGSLRVYSPVWLPPPLAVHDSRRAFHSHTSSLPSVEDTRSPPQPSVSGPSSAALSPSTPVTSQSTETFPTSVTSQSTEKLPTLVTSQSSETLPTPVTSQPTERPLTPVTSQSTERPLKPVTSQSSETLPTSVTSQSTERPLTPVASQSTERPPTSVTSQSTEKPPTPVTSQPTKRPPTPVTSQSSETLPTSVTSQSTEKAPTPVTSQPTERPLTPVTSQSTEKPPTPVTSQPTERPLTPVTSQSTGRPPTPVTSQSSETLLTPATSQSTEKPPTPVTSQPTKRPLTPVTSQSTERPPTPVTSEPTERPPTPVNSQSTERLPLEAPSSNEMVPLSEAEAVSVARQIAQSEELLTAIVERGLSTSSRQRWLDALWSSLKRETGCTRGLDASSSQFKSMAGSSTLVDSTENEHLFMSAAHSEISLPSEPSPAQPQDSTDSLELGSSQICSTSDPRDEADQIFKALDVNHDGLVGPREFRIWFSTYYLYNHLPTGARGSPMESGTSQDSSSPETDCARSSSIPSGMEPDSEKSSATCDFSVLQETAGSGSQISARRSASNRDSQHGASSVAAPVTRGTTAKENTATDSTPDITMPSATGHAATAKPTSASATRASWPLLFRVIIRSSIPYLAFGIIDNGLMLCCGEWIDSTIAVRFCLSSMASAGLGNALSCATGVVTGGCIERLCLRSRLVQKYSPVLTPQQALSRGVRNAHIAGSVMGILTGCLIGMFPLLFVKKDVGHKEKNLHTSRDAPS